MSALTNELILGGGKSGKSHCAESRAAAWLKNVEHSALLIATALPGDDEMQERIVRHRADRAARVPALQTVECADDLAAAIGQWSTPQRLIVVDCLTLWLTQHWMPLSGARPDAALWQQRQDALCAALKAAPGPLVLVSNEISMGVAPLGRELRRCLDAIGLLHQQVAAVCERVTLMVAGIEVWVKPKP